MHSCSLDDDSVGVLWNDLLFQALEKLILAGDAAEDLRSGGQLIDGKNVSRNLIFEVVKPVTFVYNSSRVTTELVRAVLDKGCKRLVRAAIV